MKSFQDWYASHLTRFGPPSAGDEWGVACCPLHDDSRPSLGVNVRTGGVNCRSQGCFSGHVSELARLTGLSVEGLPVIEYVYRSQHGKPYRRVLRMVGEDGKKTFRQAWFEGEAEGWNLRGVNENAPPIAYQLDLICNADPNEPILWLEGEKDCDTATRLGFLASTSPGGSSGFRKLPRENLEVFKGRKVVVVPDNDSPGRKYAVQVANTLANTGASVQQLDFAACWPGGTAAPKGGDLSDWLSAGGTQDDLRRLVSGAEPWVPDQSEDDRYDKVGPTGTKASALQEIAKEVKLYHTPERVSYAEFKLGQRSDGTGRVVEQARVKSQLFKSWLQSRFYDLTGKSLPRQSLQDTLDQFDAQAIFGKPERREFVRVGEYGGSVYLDLCDADRACVEITPEGYNLVYETPILFNRPKTMQPLPAPQPGGNLEDLKLILNLPDESAFCLYVGFLVSALNPNGPYAVLVLEGEQGASKSTAAKFAKQLLDPGKSPLRPLPKEERDLAVSATNCWLPCFDNLGGISGWTSDALCRLSTGGGFSTRELYSNDEEQVFDLCRPVILTGIAGLISRPDLGDRTLTIQLQPIADDARRTETELKAEFSRLRPGFLGALCTAVSAALRNKEAKPARLERLADMSKWVSGAESALPWPAGRFADAARENKEEAMISIGQSDPVAEAIVKFVETLRVPEWRGPASDLLSTLNTTAAYPRPWGWPTAANKLSARLEKLKPPLRAMGISVEKGKSGGSRNIVIRKMAENNRPGRPIVPDFRQTGREAASFPDGHAKIPGAPLLSSRPEEVTVEELDRVLLALKTLRDGQGVNVTVNLVEDSIAVDASAAIHSELREYLARNTARLITRLKERLATNVR